MLAVCGDDPRSGGLSMTATEARSSVGVGVRSRVRAATNAAERTILELLAGYEAERSPAAPRIRAALAAEGVDLGTIPARTGEELRAWKRGRQPRLAKAMPEGYAIELCECGAEYPRDTRASLGRCQRCWWKHSAALERELAEARAENEGLQQRLTETSTRRK
jgi:hypothetical protein